MQSLLQYFALFDLVGVPLENRAGACSQRRVNENRRRGHLARLHEQIQVDQQFLRPLDREGRNYEWAVRLRRAADDVAQ